MTNRETLARLRDVMARELETISMYETYAEAETDPQMKTLFQHLADEEKEHVTECYEALLNRDAAQKKWAESGSHAQAIREGHFGAAEASAPPRIAVPTVGVPAPVARPVAPVIDPTPPVVVSRRTDGNAPGIRPTPPTIGSLFGAPQV